MLIKTTENPTTLVGFPRRPPAVWEEPTEVLPRGVARLAPPPPPPAGEPPPVPVPSPSPPPSPSNPSSDSGVRVAHTARRRSIARAASQRRAASASVAGLLSLAAGVLALARVGDLEDVMAGYADATLLFAGLLLLLFARHLGRQPDGPARHANPDSPALARQRSVARL